MSSISGTIRSPLVAASLLAGMLISGCGTSSESSATFAATSNNTSLSNIFSQIATARRQGKPVDKMIATVGATSIADFFDEGLKQASDEAVTIDGVALPSIRSNLLDARDAIYALQGPYPRIADLWSSHGFKPAAAVSVSAVDAGLRTVSSFLKDNNGFAGIDGQGAHVALGLSFLSKVTNYASYVPGLVKYVPGGDKIQSGAAYLKEQILTSKYGAATVQFLEAHCDQIRAQKSKCDTAGDALTVADIAGLSEGVTELGTVPATLGAWACSATAEDVCSDSSSSSSSSSSSGAATN